MNDFDAAAYPDDFIIQGRSVKGSRDRSTGEVQIPYSDPPQVHIGTRIQHRNGPNTYDLEVLDADYQQEASLFIGTPHPHILALRTRNLSSPPQQQAATIHIGSLTGHQIQVGNQNTQTTTISINELVERVAKSDDPEARGTLKSLLENNTVAAILGAGAQSLLSLL